MLLLSSYSPSSTFLSQEENLVLEHWENTSARSCSAESSVLFTFTLCVLCCFTYSEEKKMGEKILPITRRCFLDSFQRVCC